MIIQLVITFVCILEVFLCKNQCTYSSATLEKWFTIKKDVNSPSFPTYVKNNEKNVNEFSTISILGDEYTLSKSEKLRFLSYNSYSEGIFSFELQIPKAQQEGYNFEFCAKLSDQFRLKSQLGISDAMLDFSVILRSNDPSRMYITTRKKMENEYQLLDKTSTSQIEQSIDVFDTLQRFDIAIKQKRILFFINEIEIYTSEVYDNPIAIDFDLSILYQYTHSNQEHENGFQINRICVPEDTYIIPSPVDLSKERRSIKQVQSNVTAESVTTSLIVAPILLFVFFVPLCITLLVILGCSQVISFHVQKTQIVNQRRDEALKAEPIFNYNEKDEKEVKDTLNKISINPDLFRIKLVDIRLEEKVGEGAHSRVYRCNWKGKIAAFKLLDAKKFLDNQSDIEMFEREIQITASVAHPNIVRFFGAIFEPPKVGLVMEYCKQGDLVEFMTRHKSRVKIDDKIRLFKEIAHGMEYLHERKILHRDLKTSNVLVDQHVTPKLCDFGLTKIFNRMSIRKSVKVGTSYYMAPEVVRSGEYDEKCDIFSMSIVMFEVLCVNFNPYGLDNTYGLEIKICEDPEYRPRFENESLYPSWLVNLIKTNWNFEPSARTQSFTEMIKVFTRNERKKKKNLFQSPSEDGVAMENFLKSSHPLSFDNEKEYKEYMKQNGKDENADVANSNENNDDDQSYESGGGEFEEKRIEEEEKRIKDVERRIKEEEQKVEEMKKKLQEGGMDESKDDQSDENEEYVEEEGEIDHDETESDD